MHKRKVRRAIKPARLVALGFAAIIVAGTLGLMSPLATNSGHGTPFLAALFTATSAVTMTGLAVVDTPVHYSVVGQGIIAALIQVGGFGIMAMASLVGMVITGRLGLRTMVNTAAEGRALATGEVRRTLMATLKVTAVVEIATAVVLAVRHHQGYGDSVAGAAWFGVFHSISAFNNAGFALQSDSLTSFVGDVWIIAPISCAIIIGGLGFPLLAELFRRVKLQNRLHRGKELVARPAPLSVTARTTLFATPVLLLVMFLAVCLWEWNGALAHLHGPDKLLAAVFQAVTPRTAGFNSVDFGEFHPATLLVTDMMMFTGAGSAGTAGGVKITTLAVLLAAMLAEFRGERWTSIAKRRIEPAVVRQALTVFAFSCFAVAIGVLAVMTLDPHFATDRIIFEVVSAFGTTGLSTGITANLSAGSQGVLIMLMFLGRLGPITLVASLTSIYSARGYEYPVERPFIG
ncbi:ATPase [Corynebacterium phocae]|uniref:ATPase n=1 Tax=Corynebacterium phocae TaxID=161895 RepID=A0A1L7D1J5_9CORY|nr:potassium transporter TrkG [Corynebacterium phocae]APT92036.1 ATPase [Corynebacterium phocae]KAA8726418.1 TrkH family potassium uptake protein [Corynebacterium phocae]